MAPAASHWGASWGRFSSFRLSSYDSRKPMPVIVCPHGCNGDIFSQTSPGTTNGSPIAAADATVNPVQNANVLESKLAGAVREFKIETVAGTAHLPDNVYDETTVIPFLKRVVRS